MNTIPASANAIGALGILNLQNPRLPQALTEQDPSSIYLKDAYIGRVGTASTVALGLLDRAEENIIKKVPEADPSDLEFGPIELIPLSGLLDRGLCTCLELGLADNADETLIAASMDYLDSVVGAYRVYEDADLLDESIRQAVLEQSQISIKEHRSIIKFVRFAVMPQVLFHQNLSQRAHSFAVRLHKLTERFQAVVDLITTPEKLESHLAEKRRIRDQAAAEDKERKDAETRKVAQAALEAARGAAKLKEAQGRNCKDMGKQLTTIQENLDALEPVNLEEVIEKINSTPLSSTEVVNLYKRIQPHLGTIRDFRKYKSTLDRFSSHAQTRRVELIGISEEADRLANLHAELTTRLEALSSQISQLSPLIDFTANNTLVAIGSPALAAPTPFKALTCWGNYPDPQLLTEDLEFMEALTGPHAPGFKYLMAAPELLIFAPDHLLLSDHKYRDAIVKNPEDYLRIRTKAMMDAIRAVDEDVALSLESENFTQNYATQLQAFIEGPNSSLQPLRKKLLQTIILNPKLNDVFQKQLSHFLERAKKWIDAHPQAISWPFEKPESIVHNLAKDLLPHLRDYFSSSKTTVAKDAEPIKDFGDVGYFTLLRWFSILMIHYRKTHNIEELQKAYFIMGMLPLDPDLPDVETNTSSLQAKCLMGWAQEASTTHESSNIRDAKQALDTTQILTTPSGSYILLGNNSALVDLRKYFSGNASQPYKGRPLQDDLLQSPITLTTQVGCSLSPLTSLSEDERATLGWYGEAISTLQELAQEDTNLSTSILETVAQKQKKEHALAWSHIVASINGNLETSRYPLTRAIAHHQI